MILLNLSLQTNIIIINILLILIIIIWYLYFRKIEKFKIIFIWLTLLFIINLINLRITIKNYIKNSNKIGDKGFTGIKGDKGSSGLNNISQIYINPEQDVQNLGFDRGDSIAYYNFLSKEIGDPNRHLFITEISSDRTELRLDSNILTNLDIIEQTNIFSQQRENRAYFADFYLNFGNNDLLISNNLKIDNENTDDPTVLVKLYEPLPPEFDLKSECWVVTTLNPPLSFKVSFPNQVIVFVLWSK